MQTGKRLLFIILLLSCQTLFAQSVDSSVTLRINNGKYTVSGVVTDEATKNEIINKTRAALGSEVKFSGLKVDAKASVFDKNWRQDFDRTLGRLKNWKTGLVVFVSDKTIENDKLYPPVEEAILSREITLGDNRKIKLADYADKLIVLSFLGEWAAPSRLLVPELNEIYENYSARGVEIISLGVGVDDAAGGKQIFYRYAEQSGMKFKVGWADKDLTDYFFKFSLPNGIPISFVIYKGKIRGVFVGFGPKVSEVFKKLIKETVENELEK